MTYIDIERSVINRSSALLGQLMHSRLVTLGIVDVHGNCELVYYRWLYGQHGTSSYCLQREAQARGERVNETLPCTSRPQEAAPPPATPLAMHRERLTA